MKALVEQLKAQNQQLVVGGGAGGGGGDMAQLQVGRSVAGQQQTTSPLGAGADGWRGCVRGVGPRQAMLEAKQKELQNAMYTDGNGQNAFDAEEAMLAVRRPP